MEENIAFRQGITLYDYQRESLQWLINAEQTHTYGDIRGHIPLTEPFGSGKTFIILGLIMRSPLPPMAPMYLYTRVNEDPYATLVPTIKNQIIRPTAIVVARSVYAQWVRNLETYTSLRVFEARDKPTVMRLTDMVMNGDINDYDIVLIKFGQTNVGDDGERCELCKIINRRTSPLIWSRVVYDDVDLIAESLCVRAISSIFVTGATDFAYCIRGSQKLEYSRNLLCVSQFDQKSIINDLPRVNHVFSRMFRTIRRRDAKIWATLGHPPEHIARDHGVFAICWLRCSIINTEIHRAAHLMAGIEAVDCTEVLAMINSDAMISAARLLKISVITPSAMFASVLGTQRENYEIARARQTIVERLRAIPFEVRESTSRSPDPEEDASLSPVRLSREQIAERRERLIVDAGITPEMRSRAEMALHAQGSGGDASPAIDGAFRVVEQLMNTDDALGLTLKILGEYIQRLDRSFERIRENVVGQTCSVCYGPLTEEHVAIMRCCGYILCASCCARGSRFTQHDDHVIGICIQCRRPLDIARDVIFVENGIDVDKLVQNALQVPIGVKDEPAGSSAGASSAAATSSAASSSPVEAIRTKTEYIVALISGRISVDDGSRRQREGLTIHSEPMPDIIGVMNGTQVVRATERMFLICVSFDETIDDISLALAESNIPHAMLQGSVHEYAEIIGKYMRKEVRVLILNIRALYAGVDLQSTTDIIVVDPQGTPSLGQVIGRAQRLGRTCSLTVHALNYVGHPPPHVEHDKKKGKKK